MYINSQQTGWSKASPMLFWACFLLFLLPACANDDEAEAIQNPYEFVVPENFPSPLYTFDNNPVTKEGFELGKALFYDPILSRDGSVSCNNCHIQATAFADSPVHPISVGIDNRLGIRNAPSLVNLAFFPEFFWDGGVTHLDFVPINAIEAPFEMDETVENVVAKLNANDDYKMMFKAAFGIDEPTLPFALYALSQFTNMMISADSPYDKYIREEGEILSEDALTGLAIFREKCASCHTEDNGLFTDFSYRNNGLDSTFADTGRNRITSLDSDIGKFRVPSLRNVGLTAPYMHSAKFSTLKEVLDHYGEGIVMYETLDSSLINATNGQLGISLSENEKEAIITFLHTLTDRNFVQNELFFRN